MPKFASDMPTMENVFKHHPRPEVRQGLLKDYRLKATEVLQVLMPETIVRLQSLVGDIENPESILWRGQVETGPFLAKNIKLHPPKSHSHSQTQTQRKRVKEKQCEKSLQNLDTEIEVEAGEEEEEAVNEAEDDDADGDEEDEEDEEDEGDAKVVSARLGTDKYNPRDDAFAGAKPGTSWDHVLATNPIQAEVIKVVRGEGINLYEQLNTLRVWLSLETPLIEDGNSFGADVQSHLVEQVDKYFTRTGGYVNGCNRHYHDRMIIVRRWVQMPNMPDFAEDLAASDRMDHQLARAYLRNMLLACGSLLGNFEKNWAKVINPKGSGRGGEAMY